MSRIAQHFSHIRMGHFHAVIMRRWLWLVTCFFFVTLRGRISRQFVIRQSVSCLSVLEIDDYALVCFTRFQLKVSDCNIVGPKCITMHFWQVSSCFDMLRHVSSIIIIYLSVDVLYDVFNIFSRTKENFSRFSHDNNIAYQRDKKKLKNIGFQSQNGEPDFCNFQNHKPLLVIIILPVCFCTCFQIFSWLTKLLWFKIPW